MSLGDVAEQEAHYLAAPSELNDMVVGHEDVSTIRRVRGRDDQRGERLGLDRREQRALHRHRRSAQVPRVETRDMNDRVRSINDPPGDRPASHRERRLRDDELIGRGFRGGRPVRGHVVNRSVGGQPTAIARMRQGEERGGSPLWTDSSFLAKQGPRVVVFARPGRRLTCLGTVDSGKAINTSSVGSKTNNYSVIYACSGFFAPLRIRRRLPKSQPITCGPDRVTDSVETHGVEVPEQRTSAFHGGCCVKGSDAGRP